MKLPLITVFLVACSHAAPPTVQSSCDSKLIDADRRIADAHARYQAGKGAEDSESGRAAFRGACLIHAADREIALDQLREHAQIHAYAWKDWYSRHCVPSDGVDPETGSVAEVQVCETDAGTAPARKYEPTDEENLARAQRDACDRAQ